MKNDMQPPQDMPTAENTSSPFAPLFDDTTFSDIILKADSAQVHAHKAVLAAHSPFFKAMLQSGMQESTASEITLSDMAGPVLRNLVSHMYGTLRGVGTDQLLPLFLAADAHQVASLRCRCLRQILATMDESNMLQYLQVADSLADAVLMDACLALWSNPELSTKIIHTPAMFLLMQEHTVMAQKLMLAAVAPANKRKADDMA